MKLQYLRAFIVLVAGLVTSIINIKTHKDVTISLLILLIVILIFYFLGTLIIEIFQKSLEATASSDLQIVSEEDEVEESENVHVSFDDEETE